MNSFAAFVLGLFQFVAVASAAEWDWPSATPESQGVSGPQLEAIQKRLEQKKTRAFLVIRNDQIIHEWYAPGFNADAKQGTASLAKALVGGLSLAVGITDGKISINDPASKFVPEWKNDPQKSKIQIKHLGSHTSGISDAETDNVLHEDQAGWKGEFWRRLEPPRDPFTLARDEAPILFAPGEKIQYSNPGIGMMTYCATVALGVDIRTALRDRVLRPIGARDADWSVGYGKTYTVNGLPLVCSWGGGAFTPRTSARLGRLVLHEGEWNGQRILSKEAIRDVTQSAGLAGDCGMGWWSNHGGRYKGLPRDAVWGAGAGDQLLLVIPSLNLVMVRNGELLQPGPGEEPVRKNDVFTQYHDYRAQILFEPLAAAITNKSLGAAPPKKIAGIRWAPAKTIARRAKGSDNWPMTWAKDDAVYTAYGDGNGFEPFLQEKLSMGLARLRGGPLDFQAENLRAPTIETRGHGASGLKASGMLALDDALFLLARNATNSQIAVSRDSGNTWTWAEWKFTTSFGCPTFVNYGRNYTGNVDGYAYILSPDCNDAYHTADRYVLARVPIERVLARDAYTFYTGSGWSNDIAERGAVLTRSNECYRASVTFNAGFNRFFLVQTRANAQSRDAQGRIDVRFHGGLAIYEAPEPWGPWTSVYDAESWDVGPGDSASIPSKWISEDGKSFFLVFSGDDSFSVRGGEFIF